MILKKKDEFIEIKSIEDIKSSLAKYIVTFDFNEEILKFCQKELIPCAVKTDSLKEAIFANHYEAKYIITSKNKAKEIQKVAQTYLFDSKILVKVRFDWEIELLAKDEIDGAIL